MDTITTDTSTDELRTMANAIRVLSMDAVQAANSGHPGMPMGMADVATVLFSRFLSFDPSEPEWPDRDRFVLSAGHGSMLLYSLLWLTGYRGVELDHLRAFRQIGSPAAGHPEYGHLPGIETTTGPLGQGIANGVGMAIAERLLREEYGSDICDHRTFVLAGDGCLMEGISQEAISLAGHMELDHLIVLFDDNHISIDGATDLAVSDNQLARFAASNWHTIAVDGHDTAAIEAAIAEADQADRPSIVACRTTIGFGAPNKEGTAAAHGAALGEDEIAATRARLEWTAPSFEIPTPILDAWRRVGEAGVTSRTEWETRVETLPESTRTDLLARLQGLEPTAVRESLRQVRTAFSVDRPKLATRKSSELVLSAITPDYPALLGGSADLSGSNLTLTTAHKPIEPRDFHGNYIHYGVREHAMAAAMNGIALHQGHLPYGGTFLVFADYSRPALRMAAIMGLDVIHVMTHDSIGLGEDGTTHQPVEHLAALRVIPGLQVIRPADAVETAEAWEIALRRDGTPTVLCLSRQGLPVARDTVGLGDANRVADGAYLLREPDGGRDVTLLASGSEVAIAVEAAESLATEGVAAAVVSMPCWELFATQDADAQNMVLGEAPRIGIEAAVEGIWRRWLRPEDQFIGMDGFGESGPGPELYDHFGITAAAVAAKARLATNGSIARNSQ